MFRHSRITAAVLLGFMSLLPVSVFAQSLDLGSAEREVRLEHATTLELIGEGKLEEALRNAKVAYSHSMDSLGTGHETTAVLGLSLANLLAGVASLNEALELYDLSLKRYEKIYGRSGFELASALVYMSEWLQGDEQVAAVRRALALQKQHQPEDTLAYAKMAARTGGYLALDGDTSSEAIAILEEAKSIYETEFGKKSVELIPVLMSLGDANARFRKTAAQKRHYKSAIAIAKSSGDQKKHAELLNTAGLHLMGLSASVDARTYLSKSYRLHEKIYGPDHPRTANAQLSLARFHSATGKHRRALPELKKALKVFEQDDNYRNRQMATLSLIVNAYENIGSRDEATQYCQAIGEISPWTDDQERRPIFKRPPEYPADAVRKRREGHVLIEFTVDEYGFVTSPEVIELDGPGSFKTAALEAAEKFRYAPRFVDGKPVATPEVRNKFSFKLID